MRQRFFKHCGLAERIPSAFACFLQILRGVKGLKRLPSTLAKALRQPGIQYRMALLLAALLAVLIGWTAFLLTLPHTAMAAFIRYL